MAGLILDKLPTAKIAQAVEVARDRLAWLHRRLAPAPVVLMEMVAETWAAQAITAAADLGIADALAERPLSAEELASAVDADADALPTAQGPDQPRHLLPAPRRALRTHPAGGASSP
jgi:hypothetical protein